MCLGGSQLGGAAVHLNHVDLLATRDNGHAEILFRVARCLMVMVPVQLDLMEYVPNTSRRLPNAPFWLMVSFPARVPFPFVAI